MAQVTYNSAKIKLFVTNFDIRRLPVVMGHQWYKQQQNQL